MSTGLTTTPSTATSLPPPPPAARLRRPRWCDARLVLGLLLVAASVAAGARLVSAAEQTTSVLAVHRDLAAGTVLTPDLTTTREVRLVGGPMVYLTAPPAVGAVLTRPLSAGELVPHSAVAEPPQLTDDLRHVTLTVPRAALPPGLAAGAVIDVWLPPGQSAAVADATVPEAELLLAAAAVVSVPDVTGSFGVAADDQPVVVAVPGSGRTGEELQTLIGRLVAASAARRVALSLRPVAASASMVDDAVPVPAEDAAGGS